MNVGTAWTRSDIAMRFDLSMSTLTTLAFPSSSRARIARRIARAALHELDDPAVEAGLSALLLHAARAFGAPPARCVVIEDSATGVEAANAAGMTVFGFARVTPAAELVHATGVFTSMRELPALLGCAPR